MTVVQRIVASTVVAVLAVTVGSWYALISPQRHKAATVRASVAGEQQTNDALRTTIAELTAQAAKVPAEKAQIADLQRRIPPTTDLVGLTHQLTSAAGNAGVDLSLIQPGQPATPNGTGGTTGTGAAAKPTGPNAMALSLQASGTYPQLVTFLDDLESMQRSFLASSVTVTPDTKQTGAKDVLQAVIAGQVFTTAPAVNATGTSTAPAPAGTH